jgi:hypothetical protein
MHKIEEAAKYRKRMTGIKGGSFPFKEKGLQSLMAKVV